jgi:glycosyltransferase involved in cell wall biosynthesis
MRNVTIIIPVINMDNEKNKELLKRAIDSVDDSQILIVGDEPNINEVEKMGLDKPIRVFINKSNDTTYSTNVNLGVREVKTDYFSVLEYDDVFTPIWFDNVQKYMENDTEETFAFFPLTEVIDINMGPVGFANEAVWASSFSEEIGCYDLQCLEDYLDFNTSGAIFKTDDFITLGLLKPSMKLSFWYEFLLRAAYKGKRMFVIPKIGYHHFIGRTESLSYQYGNNMSENEANWWLDLAKKEYFFPHDRNKTYQEE